MRSNGSCCWGHGRESVGFKQASSRGCALCSTESCLTLRAFGSYRAAKGQTHFVFSRADRGKPKRHADRRMVLGPRHPAETLTHRLLAQSARAHANVTLRKRNLDLVLAEFFVDGEVEFTLKPAWLEGHFTCPHGQFEI